jgi:hypothetical protein
VTVASLHFGFRAMDDFWGFRERFELVQLEPLFWNVPLRLKISFIAREPTFPFPEDLSEIFFKYMY